VPATCRNAEAAGYWINFLCKPEHALRNMDFTGYSSAVGTPEILAAVTDTLLLHPVDLSYFFGPEATAVYVDSIMYPDREIIERCSILRDCGGHQEVMREIWLRMKKMNSTDSATWYVAVGIIIIILAAIAVAVGRRKHQR
jgi:spermidine/putrescine transport system substrate-binding protein